MPYREDSDVTIIRVPRGVAVPPGDVTATDWTALTGRVTTLEEGHPLGSHTDTDFAGIADGQVPLWDSTANSGAGGFVAGDASGAIADVDGTPDVSTLTTGDGLTSTSPAAGQVEIAASFGGTGSATSVARSDHSHLTAIQFVYPYTASGPLSSGFREVVVGNPTINAGVPFLIVAKLRMTMVGAGTGRSYYTVALNIGGTLSVSEEVYCVGGVPDRWTFERTRQFTGTGAAMTIAAAINYVSDDPTDIRAGELLVTLIPAK